MALENAPRPPDPKNIELVRISDEIKTRVIQTFGRTPSYLKEPLQELYDLSKEVRDYKSQFTPDVHLVAIRERQATLADNFRQFCDIVAAAEPFESRTARARDAESLARVLLDVDALPYVTLENSLLAMKELAPNSKFTAIVAEAFRSHSLFIPPSDLQRIAEGLPTDSLAQVLKYYLEQGNQTGRFPIDAVAAFADVLRTIEDSPAAHYKQGSLKSCFRFCLTNLDDSPETVFRMVRVGVSIGIAAGSLVKEAGYAYRRCLSTGYSRDLLWGVHQHENGLIMLGASDIAAEVAIFGNKECSYDARTFFKAIAGRDEANRAATACAEFLSANLDDLSPRQLRRAASVIKSIGRFEPWTEDSGPFSRITLPLLRLTDSANLEVAAAAWGSIVHASRWLDSAAIVAKISADLEKTPEENRTMWALAAAAKLGTKAEPLMPRIAALIGIEINEETGPNLADPHLLEDRIDIRMRVRNTLWTISEDHPITRLAMDVVREPE